MTLPDFNLLPTLDILLTEGSVARAARRLRLSPSAMSRALARLREATGDPLLVRAGRGLVPTPRALELRRRTGDLVRDVTAVLRPAEALDLSRLERTFTFRTRDGMVETFGAALVARLASEAPGVRLRFVPKPDKDSAALRDGTVDLETGVVGPDEAPELRAQALFRDRFVAAVRAGHPLADSKLTPQRLAAARHVVTVREGPARGRLDDALAELGLARHVAVVVADFSAALALARAADLVAVVPERHTAGLRAGMLSLDLPIVLPDLTVSLLWHPRLDADPAHRWLRGVVHDVCSAEGL